MLRQNYRDCGIGSAELKCGIAGAGFIQLQDYPIVVSSKRGIFETRDYVNTALSQCGIAVFLTLSLTLILILILTLASCKNRTRNLALTRVSCLRIEPLQVVCLGTGSSLKLDP